jgi:hypothetical protein
MTTSLLSRCPYRWNLHLARINGEHASAKSHVRDRKKQRRPVPAVVDAHRQQIISAVIAAQLGRVQLLTPETRHLAIAVTRLREGAPAQPASAVS